MNLEPAPSVARRPAQEVTPEWLRPSAVTQLCGIKLGHLYGLMKSGAIRHATFRQPGARKGLRLIEAASLRAYIERHATGGEPPLTPLPAAAHSNSELTAA